MEMLAPAMKINKGEYYSGKMQWTLEDCNKEL